MIKTGGWVKNLKISHVVYLFLVLILVVVTFNNVTAYVYMKTAKQEFSEIVLVHRKDKLISDIRYELMFYRSNLNYILAEHNAGHKMPGDGIMRTKKTEAKIKSNLDLLHAMAINKDKMSLSNVLIVKASVVSNALFAIFEKYQAGEINDFDIQPQFEDFDNQYNQYQATLNTDNQNIVESTAKHVYNFNMIIAGATIFFLTLVTIVIRWLKLDFFTSLNKLIECLKEISSGNLSVAIDAHKNNEIGFLFQEAQSMQSSLKALIASVKKNSEDIRHCALEITAGSQDLSARTEEQASALQEAAASIEQIKITAHNNASNAHQANQVSSSASSIAIEGEKTMDAVVVTMEDIESGAKKIEDINNVITNIANQTNILALNAAVEAARAGEQGRGFAVVASEVRNLANRSSEAAKEISGLISQSARSTAEGAKLVALAGKNMKEIVASSRKVNELMQEITTASEEQSCGINQIAVAIHQMDSVTQKNATMVEESVNTADRLDSYVKRFTELVSVFRLNNHDNSC